MSPQSEDVSVNPLRVEPSEAQADALLCEQAVGGDAQALAELVRRHQRWIYNLSLRLVLSPADAEDLSQEALVRIVTRLAQFQGRASFATWAYRIVVNCFLDGKRRKMEQAVRSFEAYGQELDSLALEPLVLPPWQEPERQVMVEDAKVGCMLGMLLCLSREQRLAYVLGEVFETPSAVAAEILGVSPAAFRKRLERARRDLTGFMNDKCGLLRETNPCRCERKTRAFVAQGWVEPGKPKFTRAHVARLKASAPQSSQVLCSLEERYAALFRQHPLLEGPDLASAVTGLLANPEVRRSLGWD